jgi:phosphatidate cytidylyltransferase
MFCICSVGVFFFFFLNFVFFPTRDLTQSYFKRFGKVKESSLLIPGHGGVLDRVCGFIYASCFTMIALKISWFNVDK